MKKTVAAVAVSIGLFISAELGGNILSSDAFLWAVAPTHAYGLMAFVGMDLVLIAALWDRIRFGGTLLVVKYAGTLSIVLASVQFLAMIGDLAGLQPPMGMTASAFRTYLLSDRLYIGLIAFQPAIAAMSIWLRKQIEFRVRDLEPTRSTRLETNGEDLRSSTGLLS
jgi:hypothetical protein